ncbi:hypothetical protein EHS25_009208 [Saitozyma podzolica]|uniref:Uncharacterized protein n=1 Tax=Saitozyma podzolica TaxID=1890683 RepID=A0A427YL48_9TREE|nr:hypothetical protein EHS25_009208 [Saitozyma podzolica]
MPTSRESSPEPDDPTSHFPPLERCIASCMFRNLFGRDTFRLEADGERFGPNTTTGPNGESLRFDQATYTLWITRDDEREPPLSTTTTHPSARDFESRHSQLFDGKSGACERLQSQLDELFGDVPLGGSEARGDAQGEFVVAWSRGSWNSSESTLHIMVPMDEQTSTAVRSDPAGVASMVAGPYAC